MTNALTPTSIAIDGLLAAAPLDLLVHNWALVAIVSTVIVLVVVPYFVLRKYVRIALNIMRSTKPPLARGPLDYVRLDGEPVQFNASDGLALNGMLIRNESGAPPRGMIVFAHEFCSDMHSCARYCRPLLSAGYDVFTFDFRGHGQSECDPDYTPRQWVTDHDLNDLRGAIAYVRGWLRAQNRSEDIGLFGISRGACAALLIAAEDEGVRAIVVDGAFCTDCTIEYLMKRWAYIFARIRVLYENHHPLFWRALRWMMIRRASREFGCTFPSVRKALLRMPPRPILFIHGERDSYLPVEQSRLLYALAPQPKTLWVAPDARHNQAVVLHPERYAELTVGFFERHLSAIGDASDAAATRPDAAARDEPLTPAGV
ncbi:MAG: alpha/beta fold hydrolase [Planctomycetota bacterium]|nr:MAG: alpha/beta fold hydrolase [Planctomycetota bacterium]